MKQQTLHLWNLRCPRNHLEAIIMDSLITSNLNTRLRKQHMQNNQHTAKYRAQWAETNQAYNRKTKKELFNISTLVIKHKMTEPRQYVHMQTSGYSKLNSIHDIVLWKTQPHLATNHLKWQIFWQTFFTHKQNPSSTESVTRYSNSTFGQSKALARHIGHVWFVWKQQLQ